MSRTCTVCNHPEIDNINQMLITCTGSYRNIAERFGISTTSLVRHKKAHISETLLKAKDVKDRLQGDSLIDRLQDINQETLDILRIAKEGADHDMALKAISRLEKQIELQARLLGEIQEQQVINISVSPQWLQIRAVILNTLDPYPDVKARIAGALHELE